MHHTAKPAANAAPHSHVLLNRIVPLILRSPLHPLISRQLLLLTYTGRKSGTSYTIPVTYFRTGDLIRVFSNQRWWKNLRGGAPVTLRLRGRDLIGHASVAEDAATVVQDVQAFLATKGVRAAPMINVQLGSIRNPTAADLAERTRDHVVVTIRINGE